jgi:hypothetical protein
MILIVSGFLVFGNPSTKIYCVVTFIVFVFLALSSLHFRVSRNAQTKEMKKTHIDKKAIIPELGFACG